jgi:GNAT superfamily N-acetyltransferase
MARGLRNVLVLGAFINDRMILKILKNESIFIDLLPLEWQEGIQSIWKKNKEHALIYVLEQDNEICAGGIVFSALTPEMEVYKEEARYWFLKGYLYIGYVWVPENKRNKNYGSLLLKNLLLMDPKQHYWLTTEEQQLRYFYEKAGFTYVKTMRFQDLEEELFVY